MRRTGTSRSATSRAARRQTDDRPAPTTRAGGYSAVEALLADYPAEGRTEGQERDGTEERAEDRATWAEDRAERARGRAERAKGRAERAEEAAAAPRALDGKPVPTASTPRLATTLTTRPAYPPAEDVALGVVAVLADGAWRVGSWAIATATGFTMRAADVVRAISPTFATEMADARLATLAERGRAVREERTKVMGDVVTNAITTAATSDAMRQMSVAAIEEATDDVLAVVLPAMLEAVTELETQEKLDELMAGLLLRQLPSALEKTLPGVMMRTATKPAAGLNAFLSGVLPKG